MLKKLAAIALAAGVGVASFASPARAADEPSLIAPKVNLPKPDAEGFIALFNGKDLSGWSGLPEYWSVKDGVIVAKEEKAKSKQTFLILTAMRVSDFELHWKYKFVTAEGNSGVQFRSKIMDEKKDPFRAGGYQADCDAGNTYTGIIYDEAGGAGGRAIMSKRGEKTHWDAENKRSNEKLEKSDEELKKIIKPSGEWNDCVLIAKGNHMVYSINGNVTTDLTDDSPKAVKEGILALQCHQGFTMEVQFKDIKIKPLTEEKK